MAVSGKKYSGFQDSLSKGSAEDFDVCCDPCLLAGHNAEAKGFCLDCEENLCKTCLEYHTRSKASRHHRLQGQVQKTYTKTPVQTDSSKTCTEPCQVHRSEVIKFFCPTHEVIGCNDCMTMGHRTCKLDYIPDICAGTAKSQEFQKTLKDVEKTMKRAKDIEDKAKAVKDGNKSCIQEAVLEIERYQKKINDQLENIKQKLIQQAQTEVSSHDGNVDQTINTARQVSSALMDSQSAMQDSQSKKHDARAFTVMKQAQFKMKSCNFQTIEDELSGHTVRCVFEPNKDLEKALSVAEGFGKIKIPKQAVSSTQNVGFQSMTLKKDVNVRTKSDSETCSILGCVVISPDRLMLTDYGNTKLKIVDIKQQSVVEEKKLDERPYGICVLPQSQVAVTLWKDIMVLAVKPQMTTVRTINVDRYCYCVTYHQDRMYVACQSPNSIVILDLRGNVKRDIPITTALDNTFRLPWGIAVSNDGQHIYVSDSNSSFVACVTLDGKVSSVYTDEQINDPRGMLMSQDGSLLVCCYVSGVIYRISSDLKQGFTLTSVPKANCICYQPESQTIFVGSDSDHIKLFAVQNTAITNC